MNISPLDATFRDSARAPLHSWFHYLEGYSPKFVTGVRDAYLPNSKRILEPFSGSGTTPIVLGQIGVACDYSEANPAMAFISKIKLGVLSSIVDRDALASRLESLAADIPGILKAHKPDGSLLKAYSLAFGNSQYFNESARRDFCRLRTLNDSISEESSLLGDCLTVAILASLLPCSLMKRAGDVRYKTEKELQLPIPSPASEVERRLRIMASDLRVVSPVLMHGVFLGNDARTISIADAGDYDGVITSPPYLNGTNYIRNAKLELWYMREFNSAPDLRRLRSSVVTSGINDVDAGTNFAPVTKSIERLMSEVRDCAYDDRIAKMIGGYFSDMRCVLIKMKELMKVGGVACIDIGDSMYGGVHVKTDELLAEISCAEGFLLREIVYLRQRKSKSGAQLKQSLLVLKKDQRTRRKSIDRDSSVSLQCDAATGAI